MSKLPEKHRFIDLSDYGRKPAAWIAHQVKDTYITPVHITLSFLFVGIGASLAIFYDMPLLAGILIILKSILDAADGELSRVKQKPSFVGRYLDSICDIILNASFLFIIGYKTHYDILYIMIALLMMQLQGTLYNYYYVILRNRVRGDLTSRVLETEAPKAMPYESQRLVTFLYRIYNLLYIFFDKVIYHLDPSASQDPLSPTWFMTGVSIFGLGFQLLVMALLLNLGMAFLIIPYFIVTSLGIPLFIFIRKTFS
ncbi:CDP-alcohol phosphatidyltransferase family protein [Portibacter marinus]|uniref:CDP-alcohol phosphatidyltransferase family protein n=1 Tax=Portibacter marinus TaxID=2898660 RepID=UPI001F44A2C9|nr:CDP-alcohol phosphatidyltransferase family protein [Portibacter marinus]